MKPNKIFLVRHGESEGNVNKLVYANTPDYAVSLTDKGKLQAIDAGKKLREMAEGRFMFYISSFRRTRQTFENIVQSFNRNDFDFREDPRIIEQSWIGKLPKNGFNIVAEREREQYGHFYYRFEGGESNVEVYTRLSSFINTLFRDFDKEDFPSNVGIVMHGMSMRVLLMRWFHWTVEDFEAIRNPKNGEIIAMELQIDGKYKLVTELKKYSHRTHPYQFPLGIK